MKFLLIILVVFTGCNRPAPNHQRILPIIDVTNRSKSDVDTFFVENADSLKQYATKWDDKKFWQKFEIDTTLKKLDVFKKLDTILELEQYFEKPAPNQKRSLQLNYYLTTLEYINDSTEEYLTKNIGDILVCRAYVGKEQNTVLVNISFNNGFSGWGTKLSLVKSKFKTMPYYFDDIIDENEKEPLNFPFFQKLKLNKQQYTLGDSLYGYVEYKSIFYNEYGNPSKHNVKGYFRAVIENDLRQ